jgi:hypothetical protein
MDRQQRRSILNTPIRPQPQSVWRASRTANPQTPRHHPEIAMHWKREIELLSPTFCRGAYQDSPELREPSIRGMVRWWFRVLGGKPDEEKTAFGGMKKFGQALAGKVVASHLVFRVSEVNAVKASPDPATLPHKSGGQSSPQAAFAPGGSFQLAVMSRYAPLGSDLEKKLENALEVWILLGALGLRANRAGGSLWPTGEGTPQTPADLRKSLDVHGCHWPVYLAGPEAGADLTALRAAATDTVSEPKWLFGSARKERLASPLKFKIVRLEGKLRLLIAAPEENMIIEARKALQGHRSRPETWGKVTA